MTKATRYRLNIAVTKHSCFDSFQDLIETMVKSRYTPTLYVSRVRSRVARNRRMLVNWVYWETGIKPYSPMVPIGWIR